MKKGTFLPTKGGDGGSAPGTRALRNARGDIVAVVALGSLFRNENTRVLMTGVDLSASVPTRDPADRAHGTFDDKGMLVPAATPGGEPNRMLVSAEPRRYHPSQITSRGVSFDSAFDATHKIRQELAGIPGVGIESAEADRLDRCRGRFHVGKLL